MVNREAIVEWVAALRSGEYTQGTGALKYTNNGFAARYCCLGVACEVFAERARIAAAVLRGSGLVEFAGNHSYLPGAISEYLGLADEFDPPLLMASGVHHPASKLNDEGMSFAEIADAIERTYLADTIDLPEAGE